MCCRYLLIGLTALFLGGCVTGTSVQESLKIQPDAVSDAGKDKTVVILPFADYSEADDLESAYKRNLYITESLTDQLLSNSFHSPIQEDVFLYLVNHNIIDVVAYEGNKNTNLDRELQDEWSPAMKQELRRYMTLSRKGAAGNPVLSSPGTHGLTAQEVVKIGRHFSADYIVRGRILQYKERQDPDWSPMKKGIIGFVVGGANKIAFGQAQSDKYDDWGNMITGGAIGLAAGNDANWPWDGGDDQTVFGISGSDSANQIFWGVVGAGLGHMVSKTGHVPQAVVQMRISVQDAYTGEVVWTNRVDVKVSPETFFSDYQYDYLFEQATEKAVSTLVEDFAKSL